MEIETSVPVTVVQMNPSDSNNNNNNNNSNNNDNPCVEVGANDFHLQLMSLEESGFNKQKKNLKLLQKSGGNLEAVTRLLKAQAEFKEACQAVKKEPNEKKQKPEKEPKEKREKNSETKEPKQPKERKVLHKREKEELPTLKIPSLDSWPVVGTNLYLDGNNMMFVLSPIRSMVLRRRKPREAEAALEGLAREFAAKMALTHCTLIFDNKKCTGEDKEGFRVCSARPSFDTSDDALVAWASTSEGKGLYVTSDRGLIERLLAVNVTVCKPKEWFGFVARVLEGSEEPIEDMDAWMQSWLDKHSNNVINTNSN